MLPRKVNMEYDDDGVAEGEGVADTMLTYCSWALVRFHRDKTALKECRSRWNDVLEIMRSRPWRDVE